MFTLDDSDDEDSSRAPQATSAAREGRAVCDATSPGFGEARPLSGAKGRSVRFRSCTRRKSRARPGLPPCVLRCMRVVAHLAASWPHLGRSPHRFRPPRSVPVAVASWSAFSSAARRPARTSLRSPAARASGTQCRSTTSTTRPLRHLQLWVACGHSSEFDVPLSFTRRRSSRGPPRSSQDGLSRGVP